MNFIDVAFANKLTGDDFLQAMAGIYSNPEVYDILEQYPRFVADIISIIDYDTALQMDGLDDVINGNLCDRYSGIIDALERCGLKHESSILQKAKVLFGTDKEIYYKEYENLCSQLALQNDYEGFWDAVRAYIDKNIDSSN